MGRALGLMLLGLTLSACVQTGDFGRPKRSVWNDVVLPAAGSTAARAREEPVSRFPFTDDEVELRDRAWRFLMPAEERSWFERALADLLRHRVLPASAGIGDRTAYYRALLDADARSPASRYNRLAEDALADAGLIGPFALVAGRVIASDRLRLKGLPFIAEATEAELWNAQGRVAENRCLIGWVTEAAAARNASYRYAVERLFIAAPQGEAVAAERAIAVLDHERGRLGDLGLPPGICAPGAAAPRFWPGRDGPKGAPITAKG